MKLLYQPHIDGLRAIAVLSVIIFHINKYWLPGGFVGVDIFFVISGYLISRQIYAELDQNSFSLKEFYRRRIKRILPAAFTIIAVTIILAQFVYLPDDALKVGESALWSTFSLANVYFWLYLDGGYFANSSYETPLLHLWSLGVEEQFYIFWPLVLIAVYRFLSTTLFTLLLLLTIFISCFIGYLFVESSHSFVYYMLPSRAGELLVGALLAYFLHKKILLPFSSIKYSNINSGIGVLLLLTSFSLIDENVSFPGFYSLIPTIGSALIIWAGINQHSGIAKLLTARWLTFIGKISFSAYLWHWPLLAFYRYGYGEVTLFSGIAIFILTIIFSWLTFLLVEQKFRYSKLSFSHLCIRQLILPSFLLATLSFSIINTDGFGLRTLISSYKHTLMSVKNSAIAPNKYDYVCQYWKVESKHLSDTNCIVGDKESKTKTLLWGDSNAAHYIGILGYFAEKSGWSFRNIHHAACPPIDIAVKPFVSSKIYENCQSSLDVVIPVLDKYETLVLSASYSSYLQRDSSFLDKFKKMVVNLANKGKNIILLGKVPIFVNFDRKCKEKSIAYPFLECEDLLEGDNKLITEVNLSLSTFAKLHKNVKYYDINSFLCDDKCSPYDHNGTPLYFDASHIEIQSSWKIGQELYERGKVPELFNYLQ